MKSFSIPVRAITDPTTKDWQVLGPGEFRR